MRPRKTLDEALGQAIASPYRSWWYYPAAFWSAGALWYTMAHGAPIGRALGFAPGSAEAMLCDLALLIGLPLGALVWWHVARLDRQTRARRRAFVEAHAGRTLLVSRTNLMQVFERVGSTATGLEVRPLWDAEGPITGAGTIEAPADAFLDFDARDFIER